MDNTDLRIAADAMIFEWRWQERGRPITTFNEPPTGRADDAEQLRHALVDQINSWQPLSEPVASAMRTVERHLFVPDASLEGAYTDDTVVTRRDDNGVPTSSASAPWLVGRMLDQLQFVPSCGCWRSGPEPATTPHCWLNWSGPPVT